MQSTVLPSKGANAHMIDPNGTYLAHIRRRCRADLSPSQTDSQVDASGRKFAKPELAMVGQTDSQVDSQVHASCKKF